MFCTKCGTQNPETGKFCRSCGTDLGNVSQALSSPPMAPMAAMAPMGSVDRKGRPITCASAIPQIFLGAAFLVVAVIMGVTGMGRGWWYWMLIPAFVIMGNGVARYVQAKSAQAAVSPAGTPAALHMRSEPATLPPQRTQWVEPETRYKTGDLVPPSVTDATTRHLEMDTEGKTMTLPKT